MYSTLLQVTTLFVHTFGLNDMYIQIFNGRDLPMISICEELGAIDLYLVSGECSRNYGGMCYR